MAVTGVSENQQATARKLDALRSAMAEHRLDAYLVPSVDEHINEYLPKNRERRAWMSGFTGSAGDLLVTTADAWLFVDSRYHEQADYEVATGQIHISKLGQEGQPTLTEKLRQLGQGCDTFRLGFDPFTLTVQQAHGFQKALAHTAVELVPVAGNLVDPLWKEPPAAAREEIYALPVAVTGQDWSDKLAAVREKMRQANVTLLPVTKLDQIAWLFNLRGQDIPYNPLFTAYGLITPEQAYLFADAERIRPGDLPAYQAGVSLQPYASYRETLRQLAGEARLALIDPKHTTCGTLNLVEQSGGRVKEGDHPIELLKAVKNPTEIRGMQEANLKASRGKIRAWFWLEAQLTAGNTVTEAGFRDAIEGLYAQEEGFVGLSFNTISGAGANSSIVHYGTPDSQKTLEPGELFLIDSGCQFCAETFMGTTDDTRTMLVGETPTNLQKLRYTEVLKAHIDCAMQEFPKGTEGARLDGITRAPLWRQGLDYGHGTGHGVGAFLNVHEGPNGIHKLAVKPLEPGMVNSIEPGYYEPGWGGIRLENLYRVVEKRPGWYGFESLTYIPFDRKLIDTATLSPAQLIWLRTYYGQIVEKIGGSLPAKEQTWLEALCSV